MSSSTMISWRPENVIRHLPWRLDSKTALGFLLILATFSLVGWLYLTQASAVTTTTYRIDELRLELNQINNQNAILSLEIAQWESLSHIEKRALELGLRPTQNIRYLPVSNYPVSLDSEIPVYRTGSTKADITADVSEFEHSTWWINILDEVTAWLAKL